MTENKFGIKVIDDLVEYWHENNVDCELHEFLGLTREEFVDFVKNPNSILNTQVKLDKSPREPTDRDIKRFMEKNSGHSFYTAREELRDRAYKDYYNKPEGMSWGFFWKTY